MTQLRSSVVLLVAHACAGCTFEVAEPNGVLIGDEASWRYEDRGADFPDWQLPSFDDGSWLEGAAPLGYDCEERTTLWFGGCGDPDGCDKPITTYFRHSFELVFSGDWKDARVELQRDDGAVVYINGTAAIYSGLPTSGLGPETEATFVEEPQPTFHSFDVPIELLRDGRNVVAVEVHQANAESSDLCFDLRLSMELDEGS